MTQTREKWNCYVLSRPNFWVAWRYDGIPCVFVFNFSFRANDNKGQIDENNFRHCHDNFPESAILKVTWLQLCMLEKYHPLPQKLKLVNTT